MTSQWLFPLRAPHFKFLLQVHQNSDYRTGILHREILGFSLFRLVKFLLHLQQKLVAADSASTDPFAGLARRYPVGGGVHVCPRDHIPRLDNCAGFGRFRR